ncbi:MAG: class I SAM-dependent methyltransferase [Proteobacteria bacterium]|nr:class I SAM-dependent methyltransferase [Pseudomonadota bacterium]
MPFGPFEYFFRWQELDPELSSRWDRVAEKTARLDLSEPLISDDYFREAIQNFSAPWIAGKPRTLKLDLYNEAFGTQDLGSWLKARSRQFLGIDISPVIARRAQTRLSRDGREKAGLVVGDIRRLPFQSRSFDLVFSFGTIEHVREVRQALAEAARVLKPRGRLILFVNNLFNLFGAPLLNLGLSPWLKRYTSYEPAFSPQRVRGWVEAEGFRVIQADGIILLPKPLRYFELAVEGFGLSPLRRLARGFTGAGVKAARRLEKIDFLRRGGEMIAVVGEKAT